MGHQPSLSVASYDLTGALEYAEGWAKDGGTYESRAYWKGMADTLKVLLGMTTKVPIDSTQDPAAASLLGPYLMGQSPREQEQAQVITALEVAWAEHPHQRLTQFLFNLAAGMGESAPAFWHTPDAALLGRLQQEAPKPDCPTGSQACFEGGPDDLCPRHRAEYDAWRRSKRG